MDRFSVGIYASPFLKKFHIRRADTQVTAPDSPRHPNEKAASISRRAPPRSLSIRAVYRRGTASASPARRKRSESETGQTPRSAAPPPSTATDSLRSPSESPPSAGSPPGRKAATNTPGRTTPASPGPGLPSATGNRTAYGHARFLSTRSALSSGLPAESRKEGNRGRSARASSLKPHNVIQALYQRPESSGELLTAIRSRIVDRFDPDFAVEFAQQGADFVGRLRFRQPRQFKRKRDLLLRPLKNSRQQFLTGGRLFSHHRSPPARRPYGSTHRRARRGTVRAAPSASPASHTGSASRSQTPDTRPPSPRPPAAGGTCGSGRSWLALFVPLFMPPLPQV